MKKCNECNRQTKTEYNPISGKSGKHYIFDIWYTENEKTVCSDCISKKEIFVGQVHIQPKHQ